MPSSRQAWCQCCIVGGGPAGTMLGLLLARAGLDVIVLEKHADFLRDFRGDTIHPSTLELIHELGLLPGFLQLPHQEIEELGISFGAHTLRAVDFRHLPTRCRFLALMPQWEFLNFLAEQGRSYPTFKLHMATEAVALIEEQERIVGVRAVDGQGELTVHADLCVATDGRHSTMRKQAGLPLRSLGAPMDVLWFELARDAAAGEASLARIGGGHLLITLDRGSYWQCGLVIAKDSARQIRSRGLAALRGALLDIVPELGPAIAGLHSWKQIKLLNVQVNRLERWWRPGMLCLGDAAHAMSPIAGVGVNLAIQDAVAAANVLAEPLLDAALEARHLEHIQHRRQWPTRLTQGLQLFLQDRLIAKVISDQVEAAPLAFSLLDRFPWLRRVTGRLIGMGLRPEHIQSRDVEVVSGQPCRFRPVSSG